MPIADYSSIRDTNASIVPGNIRSSVPGNQQILNSIRQLMADLAGIGSGQVAFPAVQNPSSDPNTLDDYEENVALNPTLEGITTAGVQVYAAQEGYAVKVGRKVTFWVYLVTTSTTGTGQWRVQLNSPWTRLSNTGARAYVGIPFWGGITMPAGTISPPFGFMQDVGNSFRLYRADVNGPLSITTTITDPALTIYATGTYMSDQ